MWERVKYKILVYLGLHISQIVFPQKIMHTVVRKLKKKRAPYNYASHKEGELKGVLMVPFYFAHVIITINSPIYFYH